MHKSIYHLNYLTYINEIKSANELYNCANELPIITKETYQNNCITLK